MNKYDVFTWVKKVMDSCETHLQLIHTTNLIDLFNEKYDDIELYNMLYDYKHHLRYKVKVHKCKFDVKRYSSKS